MSSAGAPALTGTGVAIAALLVFALAYAFVIAEEFTNVRKSKPMVVAAGIIWVLVAIAARLHGSVDVERMLEHSLLDYAGLLLFLIAAITFVNALEEYNLFAALRSWMVVKGFSLRSIFWLSGLLAFAISPVLDNLTTALVMGAVVLSVGRGDVRFLVPACINIVIAANAGGAFSPFGDITTLMVWQKGAVKFVEFFDLFLPSLVNWVVPALCMHFAIPKGKPAAEATRVRVKSGGYAALALLIFTLVMTVIMHQYLQLPSWLGMMTGLGLLMLHGYVVRRREVHASNSAVRPSDAFISTMRMEWDTLLFFYGVVLCVGGIGALGYLALLSQHSYVALGPSVTNVAVGLVSAVIDNIPIMFAVLSMDPDMSHGQWLLVTLTAGVGGSLLSIGSAAGVALMGQARGVYTFMAHLKWIWAVALGYAVSIWVHCLVNAALF